MKKVPVCFIVFSITLMFLEYFGLLGNFDREHHALSVLIATCIGGVPVAYAFWVKEQKGPSSRVDALIIVSTTASIAGAIICMAAGHENWLVTFARYFVTVYMIIGLVWLVYFFVPEGTPEHNPEKIEYP